MSFLDLYASEPPKQVNLSPDLILAQHQDELKYLCKAWFKGNITMAEHTMRALNAGLQAWRDEVRR